jgi:hypothetical protein
MSRITKSIAEEVARQLVKERENEISQLKKNLSHYVTMLHIDRIPENVMKAFKSNGSYINSQQTMYITGAGFDRWFKVTMEKTLPYNGESLEVNDVDGNAIKDADNLIQDKIRAKEELRQNIEVALFNLRTYNNVEKEFPEAFKLLPKQSVNTALAINLKDIRSKLIKP